MHLAFHGHKACIRLLLKWQLNNGTYLAYEAASFEDGQTALHNAMENKDIDCSKLILEGGGSYLLSIRRADGMTPMHIARKINPKHLRSGMLQMIKEVAHNKCSLFHELQVGSNEEAYIITSGILRLITAYIETTRINLFISANKKDWADMFLRHFKREITIEDKRSIEYDIIAIMDLREAFDSFKKSMELFNSPQEHIDAIELLVLSLTGDY